MNVYPTCREATLYEIKHRYCFSVSFNCIYSTNIFIGSRVPNSELLETNLRYKDNEIQIVPQRLRDET